MGHFGKIIGRTICLSSVAGVVLALWAARVLHHGALNAALIAAVERGRATDAEDLLSRGADADAAKPWFSRVPSGRLDWELTYSNAHDKGDAPQPVLCLATERHDLAMVNILLAHGADVNARSVHDYTALTYAAGDAALTRDLLRHGADRSARDVFGDPTLPAATPPATRSNGLKLGMNKQTPNARAQGDKPWRLH